MKHPRKSSPLAIITGALCLLTSLVVVGGSFIAIVILTKRSFPVVGQILFFVGSLPLFLLIMWLTLNMMGVVERITGVEFRTRSTRPSQRKDLDSN